MHHRQHIADLPVILKKQGINHVMISPGSRNAPLIHAFQREFGNRCISIVDERSAAYVGMGIASFSKMPVVLICTSGTATLNYGPAVAEAFHLGVPLIVITADRPPEWIDQQDNQTIRQSHIYAGHVKAIFTLPVEVHHEVELWHTHRIANEAFNVAASGRQGPVHINVPIREPLYDEIPAPLDVHCIKLTPTVVFNEPGEKLKKVWKEAGRILLVAGQQPYNERLVKVMGNLGQDNRICVAGEAISNMPAEGTVRNPDLLLAMREDNHDLDPDLLICFGGPLVSKRLKEFLRNCDVKHSWYVDAAGRHVDTFRHLTDVIQADPLSFFGWLDTLKGKDGPDYNQRWQKRGKMAKTILDSLSGSIEFSDLGIMQQIFAVLPEEVILFTGNSGIVRYAGFFPPRCREVYSNRGTSGIDGCVSTAVGIALATTDTVVAVVGDQSFVYDSNALWNRSLPDNLKIIVVNNQGGGIFSLLEGPASSPAFESYFEAHHPADISKLSAAFGVDHYVCRHYDDFEDTFRSFIRQKGPAVYEIHTPREVNPGVFRNFVSHLRKAE